MVITKQACARVSFLITLEAETCNFIKKETLAQVLSCKFGEIFKNIYFTEHVRTTASDKRKKAVENNDY